MHGSLRILLTCALSCALVATAVAQDTAPAARIVSPINDQQLTLLKNSVHPLANARNDRGAAPDDMKLNRIHLVLQRSATQEADLRQLIAQMHTPGSASYHKWLTPADFGARFGPSDQDIATVENWLTSKGFSVAGVTASRQSIEFSGSVAQFRGAFHTQIHQYMVNGHLHTANATNPSIPAALSPVVAGFASLNNFPTTSDITVRGKVAYDPKTDHATPLWTTGSTGTAISLLLAPQDFAVQYDLNPLYSVGTNGTGQNIAIVNDSNIDISLVNSFRSLFGLPANPPQVIVDGNDPGVNGVNNPDGQNGAAIEAYLDVELAGAVAPNATIDLVIAGDTELESGLFLAMQHAVYSDVAPVVSVSFGGCEAANGLSSLFVGGLWEEAAAQGQTIVASSGDAGSAGCDNFDTSDYASYGLAVSGLSSTPWDVSVGGTDFYYSQYNGTSTALNNQLGTYWKLTPSNTTPAVSLKSVVPEQPWNNSQYGFDIDSWYSLYGSSSIQAGSGGASIIWSKPPWQSGAGVPADGARDLPDLSLFAANGFNLSYYPICAADGDCQPSSNGATVQVTVGAGTSAAAPSFAGIMALVNQLYGKQGQADFVLYPLAAQYPQAFHDITVGTNSVPCDFSDATPNCIAVANPIVDASSGATEGQIGTGTTPDYNAAPGYDLATGLGSVDAYQLVTNWPKVKFAATTTTLATSQSTFTHGTPITVSGTVTAAGGTPTGDVGLQSDSPDVNRQGGLLFSLSGGAYSGTVTDLPGGSYNIWAQYGGDTANGLSTSAKLPITVTPEPSTTGVRIVNMLGLALNPGVTGLSYGTQLIADTESLPTAYYNQCIVSSSPPSSCSYGYAFPTGSVTFLDNGTAINTAFINSRGDAEYNAAFGVGNHTLVARYAGDSSYSASTSASFHFNVAPDQPNVSVYSPSELLIPGEYWAGGAIQFIVSVTNYSNWGITTSSGQPLVSPLVASPTGTVTLTGLPGSVTLTCTLNPEFDPYAVGAEGTCNLTLPSTITPGNYNLTLNYSGDANYTAVTTPEPTTILPAIAPPSGLPSTINASITGSLSPLSDGITITGTVTGQNGNPAPTAVNGGVNIFADGFFAGNAGFTSSTGDVSSFSVTINRSQLNQGSNQILVQFAGDAVYSASTELLAPPLTNPLSTDFSVQTATPTVPVKAGSSGTAKIILTSQWGFAGPVTLSCSAAVGVTCSIPATATLTSGASTTVSLTVSASADTANLSYSVPIIATDSTGAFVHTLAVQAVVSDSPAGTKSFFITPLQGSLSLTSGVGPGLGTTINVWPLGGYIGTVNLKCSVSTTGSAIAPACSLTNTSLSLSGTTPQTSLLTVTPDGATALNQSAPLRWPAAGGSALALILCFAVPRRRRAWLALVALLAVVVAFPGLGCGGNSTSPLPASPGTYTVTITGTSGSLTQRTSVTVTVNN